MTGLIKGQRLFNDAVVRQKASLDDIVDAVAKYLRVKDKKQLRTGLGLQELAPTGEVNVKELSEDQEWYFQRGLIKGRVDVNKMVDLRFVQIGGHIVWGRTGASPEHSCRGGDRRETLSTGRQNGAALMEQAKRAAGASIPCAILKLAARLNSRPLSGLV